MHGAPYMLAVGTEGASRLQLVNTIYGASSRKVLRQAGLREDARVVDLACGTGSMTHWIGNQVGPRGRVMGVDSSEEQLDKAFVRCESQPQSCFIRREAGDTGLEPGCYDLVYMRLLLMHVSQPLEVLAHARSLLRPGGTLVCEEAAVNSTFCDPVVPAQAQVHLIADQMGRQRNCDYNIARRLHSLVREVGFEDVEVSAHQPVFTHGPCKQLELLSFVEALDHWVEGDAQEVARGHTLVSSLMEAAQNRDVAYGLGMMMQVQARL